ncbi:MAG TPA: sigma-54 dependent transcriptional regulator [Verrucomicrobiae bacterium]|nr:sigma-54 dependent transcriptional regulator [Verrucomicrobiae bacterium]
MSRTAKLLLVEDDSDVADSLCNVLRDEQYEVTVANRGDEGLKLAKRENFDAVLTDLRLPGMDGLELVRSLHEEKPRLPIILMTAHGTTENAINAMKLGAYDYLLKPIEMAELIDLLAKAVNARRQMTEPVELQESQGMDGARDALIGNSRPMQLIYKEIGRVATSSVPVLIRGETGTGKELIARAIYQHSQRANRPFIAINCAAVPETLLESELFGHERGAFTGADTQRIGRFEQANKGTIFLDEIGELSVNTQAKLLRVLQDQTFQRLGGKETLTIDVRVIAATHRNLEEEIAKGAFREDLYYRLNVVCIQLPPLRERREDIPALVHYFFRKHGAELGVRAPAIEPAALEILKEQPWPGNVREVENALRHLMLSTREFTISAELVREALQKAKRGKSGGITLQEWIQELLQSAKEGAGEDVLAKVTETVEKELFSQAIRLANGNQTQAAKWLGVSRLTMREKLQSFGLKERLEAV